MKKIELLFFTVAKNCVSTARRDFEKKCRADAFRAVHPDSFIHLVMEKVT